MSEATEGTVITFSDGKFNPNPVTVKAGGKLTWKNNSDQTIEIGSAPHPQHTANQELTNGQFVISLAPGEEETVTLNMAGKWGYHDHLDSSKFGQVVVE